MGDVGRDTWLLSCIESFVGPFASHLARPVPFPSLPLPFPHLMTERGSRTPCAHPNLHVLHHIWLPNHFRVHELRYLCCESQTL